MDKTILMVANVDWIFIYHRLEIAIEAKKRGYRVIVLTKNSGRSHTIQEAGLEFVDLPISRSGTNLLEEAKVINFLYKTYKELNPVLVYHVTMKPVIYGTLVCKLLKLKSVNGISGLGYNFTAGRRSIVQTLMISMMRFSFSKHNNHLIFENKDDYNELRELNIIHNKNICHITNGVGVDLELFYPRNKVTNKEKVNIILPARMLWDKGVGEFIEAANLLREEYKGKAFFKLYGMIDKGNKQAVPESFLKQKEIKGFLEWFGHHENMIDVYTEADIVVLPSYREGMPTVLLEASAMGLPLITTDAIGCRECVDDNINGYKVPVKDFNLLAEKIKDLIDNSTKRVSMGKESRKIALKKYSRLEVVNNHLEIFTSK